jgi:Protein of unknown function (DUF3592)
VFPPGAPKSRSGRQIQGILFLAVGAAMGASAIGCAISTSGFLHRAVMARGTVVGLPFGGSHPEIGFDAEGRHFVTPQGGLIGGYRIGDPVEVLYDPTNPGDARLNARGTLWAGTAMCSALSVVFTLVALVILA